jgi:hypothetical protein
MSVCLKVDPSLFSFQYLKFLLSKSLKFVFNTKDPKSRVVSLFTLDRSGVISVILTHSSIFVLKNWYSKIFSLVELIFLNTAEIGKALVE